jgi:adenine phosphoribosyltransferase
MRLDDYIRNIPDFPKPGITFKDITPLLKDPNALQYTYRAIANQYNEDEVDLVVGAESRGFLFGVGVALLLNKGFIPIRKPGKLPAAVFKETYDLEYGTDSLEIHQDAIRPGQRVLLVDDLLATGGTAKAAIELVKKCGGIIVGCAFVIELTFLTGRQKLSPYPVHSLIRY